MPEGPEIRREALRLAKALVGETAEVSFGLERLKPYEALLSGQRIDSVRSRGKALLIGFANGLTLYSHNQLYGVWKLVKNGKWPKTNRQLRVALITPEHMALLYSASEIHVLTPEQMATQPFLQRIGPDVLDAEVDYALMLARYRDPRFFKRQVAALLLDQAFSAGMGNYLRSEIMHVAGIPPQARPCDLSEARLEALARASVDLPRRSLATGGVLNDPQRVRQMKAEGKKRADYRFYAFVRENQPCYDCGEPILKTSAGSRRLYFCPQCQGEEGFG